MLTLPTPLQVTRPLHPLRASCKRTTENRAALPADTDARLNLSGSPPVYTRIARDTQQRQPVRRSQHRSVSCRCADTQQEQANELKDLSASITKLKSQIEKFRDLSGDLYRDIDDVTDAYKHIVKTCDISAWPIQHQQAKAHMLEDISYIAYHSLRFAEDEIGFCKQSMEDFVSCGPDNLGCYSDNDDEE